MERLSDAIAELIEVAPSSFVDQVVARLADSPEGRGRDGARILGALGSSGQARRWIGDLLTEWRESEIDARSLAVALSASRRVRDQRANPVELVWTGPTSRESPMRRSDQVLLALIDGAAEELLIVSFAVYPETRWVAALKRAVDRGVAVTMILESPAAGTITASGIDQLDQRLRSRLALYTWDPKQRDGDNASLHAKCVVADRRDVLVTSANLTGSALKSNMELGIRVRSFLLGQRIASLFADFIEDGVLVRL